MFEQKHCLGLTTFNVLSLIKKKKNSFKSKYDHPFKVSPKYI